MLPLVCCVNELYLVEKATDSVLDMDNGEQGKANA